MIAEQAGHLTVFQRTPQYTIPARHGTVDKAFLDEVKTRYDEHLRAGPLVAGGMPVRRRRRAPRSTVSDEERRAIYEAAWDEGGFSSCSARSTTSSSTAGPTTPPRSSSARKIREIVKDPEVAEKLVPVDHPSSARSGRCIDTNYFDTYNRDNVTLVDIRHAPIEEITPTGIRTEDGEYELDIIVFATGFDAMTGTLTAIDIQGRDGDTLKDKWADGPQTYLGVASAGFPNLFMITGPG